jgi:AbrB family looped-hinge helix DNA binding protein
METVTVSSRFRVVIPRVIREALRIRPGQKLQVIQYENRIELIPLQSAKELRGFLKGIDTVTKEHSRLDIKCAKLDPKVEQAFAEEGMTQDMAEWPEY